MYGMNSKPNMLDIHYRRLAAFSPYPYAIPLFFGEIGRASCRERVS